MLLKEASLSFLFARPDLDAKCGFTFSKGSTVFEDRGYTDFKWFAQLEQSGVFD